MKKYVSQLLQDIQDAHRSNRIEKGDVPRAEPSLEDYFSEVEAYLEFQFEDGPPFSDHCGLEKSIFPSAQSLTDIEKEAILDAMNKMLYSWHIDIDIPREAPLDMHYELTIEILDQPIFIAFDGNVTWDYCETDIPSCPYGEFCHCIEWEKEYERDLKIAESWIDNIGKKLFRLMLNERTINLELDDTCNNSSENIASLLGIESPEVPFYVTHHSEKMEEIYDAVLSIFPNSDEINEVLNSDDLFGKMEALQLFLDLKARLKNKITFLVEPFYADETRLKSGYRPVYTPEEYLEKLEHQFEIQDLAYDDLDYDYDDYDEEDDDLPF